ncbi:MAG: hypothetical protein RLZ95_974 [Bacteroidota bacterium]|jgi:hypothetical protein
MEKEGFYFPHFSNARHDRKIKRLRLELGIEGYGIYFMLLETLRDQHDLCYPMGDIDLLADEFGTSEQKVRVVVCNYGLFDVSDDNAFFSPRLLLYLEPYFKAKEQRIKAGKASALKRQANDRSTTVQQSKVNESKVNESKVKKSLLERKNEFLLSINQNNIERLNDQLDSFIDYWTEVDSKENMRFEKEKFFEVNRRVSTWVSRIYNKKEFEKPQQPGRLSRFVELSQNLDKLADQLYSNNDGTN